MNRILATQTISNESALSCILTVWVHLAIERVKHVHHTTIIYWVKQLGSRLPDTPAESNIPEVGEQGCTPNLRPLKKNKIWLWTAVNHFKPGILAWVLGDAPRGQAP